MPTLKQWMVAATLIAASAVSVRASRLNPVAWLITGKETTATPRTTIAVHVRAKIEGGYHLYSLTTPKGGPIKTSVAFGFGMLTLLTPGVFSSFKELEHNRGTGCGQGRQVPLLFAVW